MYKVKDTIKGKGAIVGVNDKTLVTKGLKDSINLDLATQKELAFLFGMGNAYIEKVDKKKK